MKTLTLTCVIFMALSPTGASARVIAGDLDNTVAVYYFTALTASDNVYDHSMNGLHGALFNGARLGRISGRDCLSLGSNAAEFEASYHNKSLSVSKEFSIVSWVKILQQINTFAICAAAYNNPIGDRWGNFVADYTGGACLEIDVDGTLRGSYIYDDSTSDVWVEVSDRNVNNNRWQHIGFVINGNSRALYLNGVQIAVFPVNEHRSFNGTGTSIYIGEGARGSVDNVGFFKNDLTDAQVRLIYEKGLSNIISIAPVDPNGKVATTWGNLKNNP